MTKRIKNRIKWMALLFGLLSIFLLGCADEQEMNTPAVEVYEGAVMRISVLAAGRSTEVGTDVENAIRTLRVFYFTEDGSLYDTHYYEPKDLMSGLPADPKQKYDYFIKDGESYVISKLMKKEIPLKVVVVANELSSLNGVTKISDIKGTVLRYYDNYNDNNKLNIIVTGSGNANRGYIPMYAETVLMSAYEWDASNGKTIGMELTRALAKVTVIIKKGTTPPTVTGSGQLKITSASIVNLPRYGWLDRSDLEYSDTYVSTQTKQFSTPLLINAAGGGNANTDMLTFYIPEHNLLEAALTNGIYTYIQVNGKLTEADGTSETNTSYRIPLGDGIAAYNGHILDIDNLSAEDLHISKNTCYQVVANVTTEGTLERFEVQVTPEQWETPTDIDANIEVPFLNVTSLDVDMSEKTVTVYFWTNQEKPFVSAEGTKMDVNQSVLEAITVNGVFQDLACAEGSTSTNFQYQPLSQGGYHGSMKFVFNTEQTYLTTAVYTLTLRAGKLTRTIAVHANPVIGKIVFHGNGGQIEAVDTFTKEVRYADNPDAVFFGQVYEMAEPTVTPPSDGRDFFTWVYSDGERQVVKEGNGNLAIVISGYVTEIKALWMTK